MIEAEGPFQDVHHVIVEDHADHGLPIADLHCVNELIAVGDRGEDLRGCLSLLQRVPPSHAVNDQSDIRLAELRIEVPHLLRIGLQILEGRGLVSADNEGPVGEDRGGGGVGIDDRAAVDDDALPCCFV